jgi:hypothetical protein
MDVMLVARVAIFACMLAACAGRQTAWTTIDPPEIPDGAEAFVLIDDHALHVANASEHDGVLHGRIVRAWQLPPAGAVAIPAENRTSSPEDIARRARWQRVAVANPRLAVPIASVRSARAAVDVEPDDDAMEGLDHGAVVGFARAVGAVIDLIACPCPCHSHREWSGCHCH